MFTMEKRKDEKDAGGASKLQKSTDSRWSQSGGAKLHRASAPWGCFGSLSPTGHLCSVSTETEFAGERTQNTVDTEAKATVRDSYSHRAVQS